MSFFKRWIGLIAIFGLCFTGCSHVRQMRMSKAEQNNYLREHKLTRLPRADVPIVINNRVIAWLEYFQGSGRKHYKRYLARSGKYHDMMMKILDEEEVPRDLFYIAMIESGFNTTARSHANAVGTWQFIRATGRRYGLRVDGWVDERRDAKKATRAAARFLKDLHDEFGDWYLAFAGYNAGEGRVRRAIKRSGSKDFWTIAKNRRLLRAETRDYVPKYLAAMIIAKSPEKFGFKNVKYQKPDSYEVVKVPTQTDFVVLAKCSGVKSDEIKRLNPELIRFATPYNAKNYSVRIPTGKKQEFLLSYAKVPVKNRITLVYHTVRRGDSLYALARRYGVSTKTLASTNNIRNARRIYPGKRLVIPIGAAGRAYLAKMQRSEPTQVASGKRYKTRYRVKSGETLGGIANRNNVSITELKRWNNIRSASSLRAGRKIIIYKRSQGGNLVAGKGDKAIHVLARGETLGEVARKYGVRSRQVMAWNGISNARLVRAGTKLAIYAQSNSASAAKVTSQVASAKPVVTKSGELIHVLQRGETLGHVAEKFGVRSRDIMKWNNIRNARRVRAGKKLTIKNQTQNIPSFAAKNLTTVTKPSVATSASPYIYYSLKSGETLGHVAEKFGTLSKHIMTWNGIKDARRVKSGARLKIKKSAINETKVLSNEVAVARLNQPALTAKKTSTYRVRSGDNLWDIARKLNVTVADLKQWNNLRGNSLRPGDKLQIGN